MTAVKAVHPGALPQARQGSVTQDERVANATRSVWERFKDGVVLTWNYTVVAVTTTWAQVTSLFFNVLDWISPSFAMKLTGLALQVRAVMESIRQGWRQEELRGENETLRTQVTLLTNRCTLLSQENDHHTLQNQAVQGREVHIVARETAVVAQRDLLVTQKARLEEENARLKGQVKISAPILITLLAQTKAAQQKIDALTQEVEDLRAKPQRDQELFAILDQLKEAGEQVQKTGERSEIDDDLEMLLPSLLRRIESAQTRLSEAKNRASPLKGLDSALTEAVELLKRIPGALKLHGHWRAEVSILRGF